MWLAKASATVGLITDFHLSDTNQAGQSWFYNWFSVIPEIFIKCLKSPIFKSSFP